MWVRRTGIAALVAALVVLIGAVPASAVSFKSPVDPYPDLPSWQHRVWVEWVQTSTGSQPLVHSFEPLNATYEADRAAALDWVKQNTSSHTSAPVQGGAKGSKVKAEARAVVKSAPAGSRPIQVKVGKAVPITAPTKIPKLAAVGGAANLALTGWFAVGATGAAVSFVGDMTGADLSGAMCSADDWVQTAYGWMTMGMGPSCQAYVADPNADATAGSRWEYNGAGFSIIGTYGKSPSIPGKPLRYCTSGDVPSGTILRARTYSTNNFESTNVIGMTDKTGGTECGTWQFGAVISNPARWVDTTMMWLTVTATGQRIDARVTTGDPSRRAECVMGWADGTTTSGLIGQYTDSVGFPVGGIDAGCALAQRDGLSPTSIGITSKNGDNGASTDILKQKVPEMSDEERAALGAGTGAGLVLTRAGLSCLTWEADCAGWWSQVKGGSTDYACTFDGVAVSISQCYVYEKTFETYTETPPVTDPVTGESVKWSSNKTANSTDPGTGPQPADQCWDEWSSAPNPVEWVFHPVQCALVWAFAPRKAVLDQKWSEAQGKWSKTMPGKIGGIVSTAFVVDTVAGCQGPRVYMPFSSVGAQWGWVDVEWYPLNACVDPAAQVAWWSRLISSAVLVYLVGLGIVRRASATVNAPGLG